MSDFNATMHQITTAGELTDTIAVFKGRYF